MSAPDFVGFPKMARFSRRVIVTEKIDGSNAQVHITDSGEVFAGSRTRWITPADDNFGFAAWVAKNASELLALGPGSHFGEWWGSGIQRKYGLINGERRFSLFNTTRWTETAPPVCCLVVPVLWTGNLDHLDVDEILRTLEYGGSVAAPGFKAPEGIVLFHEAGRVGFKKTLEKDDEPKSLGGPR